MSSLYAQYIAERLGDQIIEGVDYFATYRFPDADTVYIVDLYVVPEARKRGLAREVADMIMQIGKKAGCTKMIGSVLLSSRHSGASMQVLLAYGMVPYSSGNDFVLFKREII